MNSTDVGAAGEIYAKHAFDWDAMHVGQYYWILSSINGSVIIVDTIFPNATAEEATAALTALFADLSSGAGAVMFSSTMHTGTINDLLAQPDDLIGDYVFLGSRLIPSASYRSPKIIGDAYNRLIQVGSTG
jgi:hypothetical protein